MTEPRNPPSETGTDGFEGDPFFELGLAPTIVDDAAAAGLLTPTPIQREAIPAMLTGQDLIGLAQTGTGKTAAYLLPLLHRLLDRKKAKDVRSTSTLVLAPTRELAYQIAESVKTLSSSLKLRYLVICGGERYDHQIRSLKKGVDMIIATPGRLEDLQARGAVKLHEIEHFVLDEGDQMIDLGFYPAIKRILASLPDTRQTVLFSATMPEEMRKLAEGFLRDPVTVKVENAGQTVDTISQRALLAHNVDKRDLLVRELEAIEDGQVLVFVRTRMRADELAEWLGKQGIGVDALHGDMRQYIRQKVIRKFKTGTLKVLVATDVAARGIDMSGLRLVINFDLPETVDTYIHRIGRTGRAGREGEALSICAVVDQEKLAAILAKVGDRLVITDSEGNVVDDFVPERSPRARKGRGRPPRGQRQPGRPATARANKRPSGKSSGKPSGKPSGKSFSGKPSFDGKKKKSGGKHAAQDAGASQGPKKPYSDKPRSDRPRSDKPHSDRPRSDKPRSDRPRSDKPYAGKPKHEKQNAGKSHAGKHDAGKHKNAGNERVDRPAGASDGQDGAPSRQRLTKARLNQSPKRGGKPPAKGASRGADKRTGKGPSAQRLRGGGEGRLRRRRTG